MKPVGLTLKPSKPAMNRIKLKIKDLQSPWITNGIKKASKRKQGLYEMFLKNRNEKMSLNTKLK